MTITISKKLIKNDDLVIIPRKQYEELLRSAKKKTSQLDEDLDEAVKEYKAGKFLGPFKTVKSGFKFLESRRK